MTIYYTCQKHLLLLFLPIMYCNLFQGPVNDHSRITQDSNLVRTCWSPNIAHNRFILNKFNMLQAVINSCGCVMFDWCLYKITDHETYGSICKIHLVYISFCFSFIIYFTNLGCICIRQTFSTKPPMGQCTSFTNSLISPKGCPYTYSAFIYAAAECVILNIWFFSRFIFILSFSLSEFKRILEFIIPSLTDSIPPALSTLKWKKTDTSFKWSFELSKELFYKAFLYVLHINRKN